jgi:uncharacterized membrane protein
MTLLPMHVVAGSVAIVSGFVALYALKGATLHRKSGLVFVYAMMIMSSSGALMAMLNLNRGNVMGGGLTLYLVVTALLTTRRRVTGAEWMDRAALLLGLAVGIAGITFGVMAMSRPTGRLDQYPPPLYFIFGSVALLSAAGDARLIMVNGLQGRSRLVRHVWRMCFAMFIATGSFFLGQATVIPKPIRVMPALTFLALLPLALMLYWLVRVSFARPQRYVRSNA